MLLIAKAHSVWRQAMIARIRCCFYVSSALACLCGIAAQALADPEDPRPGRIPAYAAPDDPTVFIPDFATDADVGDADAPRALPDPRDSRSSPISFPGCVPPPRGLVSWWPFDEGPGQRITDIAGPNNGRLDSPPRDPTRSAGLAGNGLSFDGMDDTVVIHLHESSPDIAGDQATLEAWIFPTAIKTQIVMGRGVRYGLALSGTNHFVFTLSRPMLQARACCYPTDTWIHMAGTYDGHGMRLYIDGELVDTVPRTGPISPLGGLLLIGTEKATPADTFQGMIDEVAMFDRALSESEIRDIYEAGALGKCKGDPRRAPPAKGSRIAYRPGTSAGSTSPCLRQPTLSSHV